MNLPNALTLLRIFLVPLLVALLLGIDQATPAAVFGLPRDLLALGLFLAASATDLLDGYLARRWHQITTVGMLLDPIADKLLVSAALIALVQVRVVPAWVVIVIVGREFAVSGLRSIAAAQGITIQASDLGKAKMAGQVLAIGLLIASLRWTGLRGAALAVLYGVGAVTLLSAGDYFARFWGSVDVDVKRRSRGELLVRERDRLAGRRTEP